MPTKDDAPEPSPVHVVPPPPGANDPNESTEDPTEDDEALLRALGQWLHAREAADATEVDLVVPPPPPAIDDAELGARVDALVGSSGPRILRRVLSHVAVAAAAVGAVQLGTMVVERSTEPPGANYSLDLRGGDGQVFAPSSGDRIYSSDSTFELKLRPDRAVTAPVEVMITACREGTDCDTGTFRIRLGPEALEVDERGGLHYRAPVSSTLPLAPGRWTLTFAVGAPGACLLEVPEQPCRELGRASVELREAGGRDAK
ncbi:hypothetical protein [Paraliomyxa miuraensis]|uniref:hypothetical protein n=1 Tax=Paraliomyxa miuraensis TaxID=376150 RepID=UPI002257552A|nr:hypothetical protein [Paraliomyxa miuraensis]MCX4240596.1 hypothetical protein [Paraliomyxa miuraensis]